MNNHFVQADLHVHSYYSKDSLLSPEKILMSAKNRGLQLIAITDHNTISGGLVAKQFEDKVGVKVIIGAEIASDIGDIIGLNLTREIKAKQWKEVVAEIRSQNGVVVLPHPYREHKEIVEIAGMVDFIEAFNSRCNQIQNQKAVELAKRFNKKCVVGSDAHTVNEIGNSRIMISYDLKEVGEPSRQECAKALDIYFSQAVGLARTGKLLRLVYLTCRLVLNRLIISRTNNKGIVRG